MRWRWSVTLQLNLQVVDDRLKVLENKLILDKLVKKLRVGMCLFLCPSVSQCHFLELLNHLLN